MTEENPPFTPLRVNWEYINDPILPGNRSPSGPIRGGPRSIAVRCNSCGNEWEARRGPDLRGGTCFLPVIGFVYLQCPDCGAGAPLNNAAVDDV